MEMIDHKVDGTPLTKAEMEDVNRLTKELYSPTTIDPFTGRKTRSILETMGVESPSLVGRIKICSDPETWVVPKEEVTEENMEAYIKKMRKKYRLNHRKS